MEVQPNDSRDEPFPWHLGIYDAHCHPTDAVISVRQVSSMKAKALIIMATRQQDQDIVAGYADDVGVMQERISQVVGNNEPQCQVIPSFGWHPWFSHLIYDDCALDSKIRAEKPDKTEHYRNVVYPLPRDDGFILSLPDPRPMSEYLAETRKYLERFPSALVGEIGLDRAFRVPENWLPGQLDERNQELTPGGREGRRLSPYRIQLDHQKQILKAQLKLAGEMNRAVSVHGVAAHGALFEALQESWRGHELKVPSKRALKRRSHTGDHSGDEDEARSKSVASDEHYYPRKHFPPRICLHSYSGPVGLLRQYLDPSVPATIFFSFSRLVNFSTSSTKAVEAIKAVPSDRLLIESDFHYAGEEMDGLLEQITRSICIIKQWPLEEGVKQLAANWAQFAFG